MRESKPNRSGPRREPATGALLRERALRALLAVDLQEQGSQSALNQALAAEPPLPLNDRRLCTELVYGVLRRQRALDRWIAPACQRGLYDMAPAVLAALRLGAYQLCELQRVPAYAAVDATVEACKSVAELPAKAVGFVHAVLRQLARQAADGQLPDRDDLPPWIDQRVGDLARDLGLNADELRQAFLGMAPLHLHAVTPRGFEGLRESDIPLAELAVPGTAQAPSEALHHPDFAKHFVAQDAASAAITEWLEPGPGQTILEVAAGRGVKSACLAAAGADVTALDLAPGKLAEAEGLAQQLGAPLHQTLVADATQPLPLGDAQFDAVLVDAPCSGLGTLRRRPEIRHRRRAADLVGLTQIQDQIADQAARHVRPGGILLLATCSIADEEGPQWCQRFTAKHPEFKLDPGALPWLQPLLTGPGWLRTHPLQDGMDGFFAARLRRDPK
ncbi:MAG: methyltransferase domain-containing protein [Deltaproteobacteria bacterium]|nr:methyltransferase domain-containing protein [Deltaproteobacteria bacterium]